MAKSKKQEAKAALSSPGWGAQFEGQPSIEVKKEPKFKRKTYLLTDELVDRMAAQAVANKVGVNDLARYLLDHVLTLAESGEIPIPIRTEQIEEVPGRVVIKNVIDV